MRHALLLAGIVTLAVAWFGPLPDLAHRSFAAHMTMHMAIVAVAAPLLALGVAGTRFDPVRALPHLFPPIPISILELIVVWGWHAPGLHHAARHTSIGLIAEQGSFLACGLLLWLSAVGGDHCRRPARLGAGVVALLLTSMHMTLLGALLALAQRPLYAHAEHPPGLTPLADQHLGGAIMLLIGGIAYLAGGVAVTAAFLKARSPAAEGGSGGVAGSGESGA